MSEIKQTFGEHLEVLRRMLFRILAVVFAIAMTVFCLKDYLFEILLGPCKADFVSFRVLRNIIESISGQRSEVFNNNLELIATDISSQLMTHISLSIYFGLLIASPFVLHELMKYISPALYENERKYSVRFMFSSYILFLLGTIISYFLLFPISCRFLISYDVSQMVTTMATLDSYVTLFISLTLLMGFVFQLPILCFLLAKLGLIDHRRMIQYRKYAIILIMIVASIITPPDILTLIIVTLPLYFLYEMSIKVVKFTCENNKYKDD